MTRAISLGAASSPRGCRARPAGEQPGLDPARHFIEHQRVVTFEVEHEDLLALGLLISVFVHRKRP
jgi:hypothetical protein